MTAAGLPVRLCGKTYYLAQLRLEDFGAIEKRILQDRRKPSEVLPELLSTLPAEQHRTLLEIAWTDEVRGQRVRHSEVLEWLATPVGRIYRLWLMMKRNHPELSLDDVQRLIEEDGSVNQVADELEGQPLGNSPSPEPSGEATAASPGVTSSEP